MSGPDVAHSERQDDVLGAYAQKMAWVLANKDFNAFWPVGLPRAGTAMGDQLVTHVEAHFASTSVADLRVPNPTAVLILLFFSTYGIREAAWPLSRRLDYAAGLLGVVANSKTSPVVDAQGRHMLVNQPPPVEAWSQGAVTGVNTLAALSWACAECLYFCNHRIGTERHGPYTGSPGHHVMVRSIFDLAPAVLWPEVDRWPKLPKRIDLVFEYPDTYRAPFDLFANPLFEFNTNEVPIRTAVLATMDHSTQAIPIVDHAVIDRWNEALRASIVQVAGVVNTMSTAARIQRLHQIMLYACAGIFGNHAGTLPVEHLPCSQGREIGGDPEVLQRYYDLRQEAP